MGRSPGFGLAHTDLRPLQARSPCGYGISMPYPCRHAQLAGPFYKKYAVVLCNTSTACGHGVSGSLSLPSRGPFHLSLTVLSSIGHFGCLALGGGPPCFLQGSTCLVVLWYRLHEISLRVRDFHPLWSAFPKQFRLKISCVWRPATP